MSKLSVRELIVIDTDHIKEQKTTKLPFKNLLHSLWINIIDYHELKPVNRLINIFTIASLSLER